MTLPVVIIGAGPVGLTLAAELSRYGVPFRIVDRAAHRSEHSKALVLWSRSLELLDRMGCGSDFLARGRKALAASIYARGERTAHIGFDEVKGPHPYALMLPQSETERLLEEHLSRRGVAVERNTEVTRLAPDHAGVTVDLRRADGGAEAVRCDWVVGCDGAHSLVRHTLGIPFAGSTLRSQWILADVHLHGAPIADDEVTLFWHAEGVLAAFPITAGRYRLIADVGDTSRPDELSLAEVQAVIDRRGPSGVVLSDPVWLSRFHINERKVADYRVGRVFVAGDAAHVHSPAGGQGMNTGMQDVANLAWKLALVVRGAAGEALLDSYSAERSAIGDIVLRNADRLTALAVLRNPALQSVRDHLAHALLGLRPVRNTVAETMTETSIRYATGPLVVGGSGHGGPASGEPVLLAPGERPIGAGTHPRFTLLADADAALAPLVARHPDLLDPVVRPALHPGGLWLVRPDGYVAIAARAGDILSVEAYLEGLAA